jgi:hypothetical protein
MPMPKRLGPDGRHLWRWVSARYVTDGCEPLLNEICEVTDRLCRVRESLRGTDKPDTRLLAAEVKLLAQYARLWKLLGLADEQRAERRRVGRPEGGRGLDEQA